jgi:hypothetical protein
MHKNFCVGVMFFFLFYAPTAPTQAPAADASISYGIPALSTVGCGTSDEYAISARAGEKILLHLTETRDFGGVCSGVAAFQFDQCIEIFDPTDQLLASACTPIEINHQNKYRTQRGPILIPYDGEYRIVVRDANNRGRGTYTLWIQNITSPARSQWLDSSVPRLMPLQSPGKVHTFVFDAQRNDRINAVMETQTGDIKPRLALYSPQGDPVALPEGGAIDVIAPMSGAYTLLAFSAISEIGTYTLKMSTGSPPSQTPSAMVGPFHFFPQIAVGGGWSTSIVATNVVDSPATCIISVASEDSGTKPSAAQRFVLPRRGSVRRVEVTRTDFSEVVTGYATISCDMDITALTILGLNDQASGSPISMFTVFSSQSSSESVLPLYLNKGLGNNLGVAIANDSDDFVDLEVQLYSELDELAGYTRLEIPPRGHIARLITELLSVPDSDGFKGSIQISSISNNRFYLIGFLSNGAVWTTIPATQLRP